MSTVLKFLYFITHAILTSVSFLEQCLCAIFWFNNVQNVKGHIRITLNKSTNEPFKHYTDTILISNRNCVMSLFMQQQLYHPCNIGHSYTLSCYNFHALHMMLFFQCRFFWQTIVFLNISVKYNYRTVYRI